MPMSGPTVVRRQLGRRLRRLRGLRASRRGNRDRSQINGKRSNEIDGDSVVDLQDGTIP